VSHFKDDARKAFGLSDRDKTPKPSGFGVDFHHTDPQRHISCILGDMLAPRSADDIAPITPEAMESVQAALKLLANLVGDRDHSFFLGDGDTKSERNCAEARAIQRIAKSLTGILRVIPGSGS
jgi:hypothetical protein